MLQSKLDSVPVNDSATAEAWQPSVNDDDYDESSSVPISVTLPATEPGIAMFLFISVSQQ